MDILAVSGSLFDSKIIVPVLYKNNKNKKIEKDNNKIFFKKNKTIEFER